MSFRLLFLFMSFLFVWSSAAQAESGRAVVKATSETSKVSGTVLLEDTPSGLKVIAEISGLTPGSHGFHIHEFGSCEEAGAAAGSHYNPAGTPHGHFEHGAAASHPGDMGNLEAGADGTARLEAVLPGAALSRGTAPVAGRSVIVHEKPDDFSQPTGNAGGRVGCGKILIVKPQA